MHDGKLPKVRVLVLDGRIQSCLPVLKALRIGGHHVTIAESDPLCVGFFSRYPHQRLRHRDPRKDPDGFLADLKGWLSRGDYDVLIPILDVTAELVSKHKSELENYVRIPIVDYPIFMRARDKSQTMKIAQANGLPCPKTYFPDETPLEEIARIVGYPALIKPNKSVGARGLTKVTNSLEMMKLYPKVVQHYGECSIQEFIPQSDLQYKAQYFLDIHSKVKACVVYNKIRFFPLDGGVSTLNCTVIREDIVRIGTSILKAMGWKSYADIDLISDPRDNRIKILEVNPRITGSIKICFEAGVNFANLLIAFALGHSLSISNGYKTNVYLRHPGLDLLWFLKSRERFNTHPSWFQFYNKNLTYDILSLTDPGPSLAYAVANLRDLFLPEARRYKYQRSYLG